MRYNDEISDPTYLRNSSTGSITFDEWHRPVSITDTQGYLLSYTLDELGRVTQLDDHRATPIPITYSYNKRGDLLTLTYDPSGANRSYGFTYNEDGSLDTVTDSNSYTETNAYDNAGRLSTRTFKNSGGTQIEQHSYNHNLA